jgi:MoaA/NifB/PqqE/SkfB family radical SAM enzyme
MSRTPDKAQLDLLWLELTHRCNLQCQHCYTDSSPRSPTGTLTAPAWQDLLTEAAAIGVGTVMFIGGEPTLDPRLPTLIDHAHEAGVRCEVFTNLTRISEELWDCFIRNSVGLATSIYSADPLEHDRVTTRRGSHGRTMRNLARAREIGLPLRAGIVQVNLSQRTDDLAERLTETLGIETTVDVHRKLGRGHAHSEDFGQLCGRCAKGSAVVDPDGRVFPCIMSRWLDCGDVRRSSLRDIVAGGLAEQRGILERDFAKRRPDAGTPGDGCGPITMCPPALAECPPHFTGPCAPNCAPYRG